MLPLIETNHMYSLLILHREPDTALRVQNEHSVTLSEQNVNCNFKLSPKKNKEATRFKATILDEN